MMQPPALQAQYQVEYCAECLQKADKRLGWFIPADLAPGQGSIHSVVGLSDDTLTMACGLEVKQEAKIDWWNDWSSPTMWAVAIPLGVFGGIFLVVVAIIAAPFAGMAWRLLAAYLGS